MSGADYVHQDVADEDGWKRPMAHVDGRYGHLDVLVNNAGIANIGNIGNIESTTIEQYT